MMSRYSYFAAAGALLLALPAFAQTTVVTFDEGWSGWNAPAETVAPEGGNPGANAHIVFGGYGLTLWTDSDAAFLGDYGTATPVTIGLDVEAQALTSIGGTPITQPLLVEFRNYAYASDDAPYASVWYPLGTLASGQAWTTWSVSFDPTAAALPAGWGGTGAFDPETGEPVLPAGVGFADVLAQVDEVAFTTVTPGTFSVQVNYDVRFDNLRIARGETPGPTAPPRYAVVDLGTFGGELANAHAINDQGHVVGTAERPDQNALPFVWRGEALINLGSLIPGQAEGFGVAHAISENGLVAGYSAAPYPLGPGSVGHAFFWSPEAGMIDLTPDSPALSIARAVNDAGQVVGEIGGSGGGAFIWSAQAGFSVIQLPSMLFTSNAAEDINASGQVVGHAFNTDSQYAGWVYDSATGESRQLPPLERAPSQTRAINDAGDVVGYSARSNNQQRPVLWRHDGTVVDLGFLPVPGFSTGYATDINEQGWVIGADYADAPGIPTKGWLWIGGEKHELRTLLADPQAQIDWSEFSTPLGINNRGEIVGIGIREGLPGRAFLLRPLGDVLFADGFEAEE